MGKIARVDYVAAAQIEFERLYGCLPHQKPELYNEWVSILNKHQSQMFQNNSKLRAETLAKRAKTSKTQ